ncbi:methyltransferase domain-containing protein [Micromonospora sp. 15K316]|uniref:class I SAM-dependent methyltransferase n=1 Tax=Micromonospora sp. 15K316 TaxID=2530376 RepID=UPI0010505F06|nr:class I SAM-dependent methyltransferase [Micromonospora sp. 15K316]TDC40385.1 methyltransferase domain-containing protein [Micromonospora sp. 15K316]
MPAEAQSTFYDLLHADDSRDPAAEADALLRIIRARRPHATSLLDVACGAGDHLRHLLPYLAVAEGVAVDAAMAGAARGALPGTTIHEAALPELDLGRRYDVVTCLHDALAQFPLSGYHAVLRVLARHLAPGGLIMIAPFWMPDAAIRRTASEALTRGDDGRAVTRIERGVPRDGAHRVEHHALVADGDGVRHVADTRLLRAFGRREHLSALAAAGCAADFLPAGLAGRPLLIGVRR